jgi:selenide,water dikinase
MTRKHLVLVGGGHAHVFVLRAFGVDPMPDLEITLVAKEVMAPYSGMLPGFVAGHYSLSECQIDLERLASFAGARIIEGVATGIDPATRRVHVAGRESLTYDVLSLDVGITPDTREIEGADAHALLVKPVSEFAPKWQRVLDRARRPGGPRRFVAAGGGAAGVELILAARHRLTAPQTEEERRSDPFTFTLIAGDGVLAGHSHRAQRLAREALARVRVDVIENDVAVEITPEAVRLRSGRVLPCDAAMVSTRAQAPPWFAGTGLALDGNGYLALRPTLQSMSDGDIFAAGDCATVLAHPRPKAGVFAVRQGPVLARHLRRHLERRRLEPFVPQRAFLSLVSLGEKSAIASRGSWAAAGRWAWVWKDFIDRRFMAGFNRM